MQIERKKINFEDSRGRITDIFVNEPKSHGTLIFTKKGGIRANHYHARSWQHDFIISGSFKAYGKTVGEETITEAVLKPNDFVTWPPNTIHEFIALEDSLFLTFVNGPRAGENFESDTIRISPPLHEQAQS